MTKAFPLDFLLVSQLFPQLEVITALLFSFFPFVFFSFLVFSLTGLRDGSEQGEGIVLKLLLLDMEFMFVFCVYVFVHAYGVYEDI